LASGHTRWFTRSLLQTLPVLPAASLIFSGLRYRPAEKSWSSTGAWPIISTPNGSTGTGPETLVPETGPTGITSLAGHVQVGRTAVPLNAPCLQDAACGAVSGIRARGGGTGARPRCHSGSRRLGVADLSPAGRPSCQRLSAAPHRNPGDHRPYSDLPVPA